VVLYQAVELLREVGSVKARGQLHEGRQLVGRQAFVQAAHGLIPQELDGVAVVDDHGLDLACARQGRPVRTHQVLRLQAQQVVQPDQQHARIAVFLATDGEHVEERRPHQVVDGHAQRGEPHRHRIVRVRRCGRELHRQPGQRGVGGLAEHVGRRKVAAGVGRMRRVAEERAQADADHPVGAVGGQPDAELVDQPALVHRRDLAAGALQVGRHARMGPDRQRLRVGQRRGAGHIVEVGVDHRHHRGLGVLAQLVQCALHLLHRFTGVDGDHALGALHEGLVRQAVADAGPHPRTHRVEAPGDAFGLLHRQPVGPLAGGPGDHGAVVGGKAGFEIGACGHGVSGNTAPRVPG